MKKTYLMLSICTLASGLLLQSSAWGYTVTADTAFTWLNSSFSATGHGTDVPSGSIVSGSSGDASSYTGSFSNAYSGWSWTAAVVQDYGIFYAQASTQAHRDFPGNDFEAFQNMASGTFIQTLTIPGPAGSTGTLMLGWDVTGSSSNGSSGSAYLGIIASTNASLPNTYGYSPAIISNGHYDLSSPISFTFGMPFQLTIDSYIQANVGYDYRYTTAPSSFSDAASADFLHTVILSSVGVNDSAGSSIPDFTIITDSGRPFLPAAAPASVPEPVTMLLLGSGLVGLTGFRRKIKSSRQ